MAGSVRIAGPEFSDARSRAAFARIEESVRQFTSHSRESITIVRNPCSISVDHFVVLWGKGAAVTGLVHQGGRVRGGMNERWSQETPDRAGSIDFDNPLPQIAQARKELISLFQSATNSRPLPIPGVPAAEAVNADPDVEEDPVSEMERERLEVERVKTRNAGLEHCTRGLVILTLPVERIRIDGIDDHRDLGVFSIDQAVNRTIFHMPNLLRVIDFETSFFTPEDIAKVADKLEGQAASQSKQRPSYSDQNGETLNNGRKKPQSKLLFILLGIAVAAIVGYLLVSPRGPGRDPSNGPDTLQVKPVDPQTRPAPKSVIVLTLPVETQAFISPIQYNTRAELLRAIGAGEGTRMLPQKYQPITIDSIQFAKGVYGYFKVEGTWRRGKLLQTLKARDTVMIENFLPPLP